MHDLGRFNFTLAYGTGLSHINFMVSLEEEVPLAFVNLIS